MHDNPALCQAAKSSSKLIPLFILDPWFLNPSKVCANRMGFLLESLKCLDDELRQQGSRLFIAKGQPQDVLTAFFKELDIKTIFFENDTEPYAKVRDESVKKLAASHNVKVETFSSHTLFDPDKLLRLTPSGKAPLTMTSFLSVISKAGEVPKPLDAPSSLPNPPTDLSVKGAAMYESVPTLADMKENGYDPQQSTTWFVAGEKEAIKRMEDFLAQGKRTITFEKPKTLPTALEPDTTALSPYLKFGSLSCRLFYHRLKEVYRSSGGKHSKPPVSLEGQLYWREMSYLIGYSVPNFDRMEGNPVCKQIPWRTGPEAEELLAKWEAGQTGFPAVDAAMNQLRNEGWLHHLARHLVACFLTRGDLWVHWELGRDVFERHLVDADWSINNFSWHWLSCSAFFHQFFRVYGPVTFFKKTDPSGAYIRKHIPCLKRFPDKYIYEPWLAPKNVQEKFGCIIGKDYPKPIVDHQKASKENIGKMKAAYDKSKTGGKSNAKSAGSSKETGGEPSKKKQKLSKMSDFF